MKEVVVKKLQLNGLVFTSQIKASYKIITRNSQNENKKVMINH